MSTSLRITVTLTSPRAAAGRPRSVTVSRFYKLGERAREDAAALAAFQQHASDALAAAIDRALARPMRRAPALGPLLPSARRGGTPNTPRRALDRKARR
jgi:hypothetical protein